MSVYRGLYNFVTTNQQCFSVVQLNSSNLVNKREKKHLSLQSIIIIIIYSAMVR